MSTRAKPERAARAAAAACERRVPVLTVEDIHCLVANADCLRGMAYGLECAARRVHDPQLALALMGEANVALVEAAKLYASPPIATHRTGKPAVLALTADHIVAQLEQVAKLFCNYTATPRQLESISTALRRAQAAVSSNQDVALPTEEHRE